MYRVVIADDSAAFLEWLKTLLESSQDFEVIGEAQDGTGALEAVAANPPDLLLVDVEMPAMDGIDLAKIIAEKWPDISVILTSSNNEPFYYRAADRINARAFIAKIDLTLAAIREALGEARRR